MTEKKELSQLARQILSGGGHVKLFNQQEFDESLALAQAEIMHVAVETTKRAIMIEREECAKIVEGWDSGLGSEPDMREVAEAIRNRIPSQRQ